MHDLFSRRLVTLFTPPLLVFLAPRGTRLGTRHTFFLSLWRDDRPGRLTTVSSIFELTEP